MSAPDDSTRPVSVAELLARNGTIGSPPVGGRRRRRRGKNAGVSVSELTGEIPVIRTGEIPVVSDETVYAETVYEETAYQETAYQETAYQETVYEDVAAGETVYAETVYAEPVYAEPVYEETVYEEPVYQETVYEDVAAGETVYAETVYQEATFQEAAPEDTFHEGTDTVYEEDTVYADVAPGETVYEEVSYVEAAPEEPVIGSSETVVLYPSTEVPEHVGDYTAEAVPEDGAPEDAWPPPLASDPLPRRSDGPQRGYDPRPLRRSSGAEQMSFDPVDESVNLDDLLDEQVEDVEHLRSYLRAPQDTLFSGETVADDLARRGIDSGDARSAATAGTAADRDIAVPSPPGALWNGVLAVLQSLMAVALGAALFIGFDQLWRWNRLVALILSVLVVLTLAAAVRIVRKTEDIVSTLTAVAVGLLVTLGPLALQST